MGNIITIEGTGKTVEEALDKACKSLGCKRDECTFEIVDLPRKKFFGLRTIPARVRVSIEVPEEVKKAKAEAAAKTPRTAPVSTPKVAPKAPIAPTKAPQKKEKSQEKPKEKLNERPKERPSSWASAVKATPEVTAVETTPPVLDGPPIEVVKEVSAAIDREKMAIATQYVKNIVKTMGIEVEMTVSENERGLHIALEGDDLGAIIGRRGETLDAIQYLAGLATNRADGEYLRITIDSGDYRLKREQSLVDLAKRTTSQVMKTNISRTLEPMSASERRVVHATVSEIEGVSSHSVGRDPSRRVVIKTPTSTSRSRSNGTRNSSTSRRTEHEFSPPKQESPQDTFEEQEPSVLTPTAPTAPIAPTAPVAPIAPAAPAAPVAPTAPIAPTAPAAPAAPILDKKEATTIAEDTPLYGKIDL